MAMAMGYSEKKCIKSSKINIMKLLILIVMLLNIQACDGQNKKNNNHVTAKNTTDKMNKFDIDSFEKNKGKQGYVNEYHYTLNDNSNIREFSSKAASDKFELRYQRELTKKFNPKKYYYYYYPTEIINKEVLEFNNSLLNVKEYDKNGKLIKEINFDKNFKHTFEQIHDIVMKEKKVDIYDTRQAVALRHDTPDAYPKKYYQIHVLKSELVEGEWYSQPNYSFLIDDETGKIIIQE